MRSDGNGRTRDKEEADTGRAKLLDERGAKKAEGKKVQERGSDPER